MANPAERNALNVAGSWYVDAACIACGLCEGLASRNFRMSEDGSMALVFKQPEGPADLADCEEALAACPVAAIGKDG